MAEPDSEPRVVIFSSPQCTQCEQAKALLNKQGIAFDERNLGSDEQHREDLLSRLPQVRALPQLFIDEVSIGSTEDLKILIEKGELNALLNKSS